MEDAAASLGTDHLIFKVAASYVDGLIKMIAASKGLPHSIIQSEQVKIGMEKKWKMQVLELLKWAQIDLTTTIM